MQWAEREGYAVDVVTNADLEDHPELLSGPGDGSYALYLSVGHDEYWSGPMRDTVEGFIARGGNAAFLSGNTAFWQVRLEQPTPEGPAATMIGYKGNLKSDPVYGTDRVGELSCMWSDALVERPENHMTGVSFVRGGYHRIGKRATRGAGGYTIHRPDHWLFDGTDIGYGDLLGAGGVNGAGLRITIALGKAALIVDATLLVSRELVPRVLAWVDSSRSREVFLLAVLGLAAYLGVLKRAHVRRSRE